MSEPRATPVRALAIGAHPDDIEFGCGATLARWAREGCEVSLFVCTDGAKGSWDPHVDPAELVVRRRSEQHDAARAIGATGEVLFGDWVDGELASGLRERAVVAAVIRRLQPEIVLGHDPWKRYRLHPDHHHAGRLTCEGVVAARDPHFFPELALAHHRPAELWLFEAEEPDHVEPASLEDVRAKLAALEAHRSQFESTMYVSEDDDGTELEAFRRGVRDEVETVGGEPFRRLTEL